MDRVSVVVSVYSKDRLGCLLECLDSLKKQSVKPFEVIVVLDPVRDLVEFYRSRLDCDVKVVVSNGFGLSNARNAGVKNARGDIVAFIDDDAVADKDWLLNLLESYKDSKVVGVGGLIKPLWEGSRPKWFPHELYWIVGCSYKGLPEYKAVVRNPIGCNMSFKRIAFEKVGYFRSDVGRFGRKLLAGEEAEFSMRVLEKIPDSKIIYEPSAVVYHRVNKKRLNLKYLWKRAFYEGLSKALIINSKKNSPVALTAEDTYLRYLFKVTIPSKLKRIYKPSSICQLLMLIFSVSAVFAGFIIGRLVRDVEK